MLIPTSYRWHTWFCLYLINLFFITCVFTSRFMVIINWVFHVTETRFNILVYIILFIEKCVTMYYFLYFAQSPKNLSVLFCISKQQIIVHHITYSFLMNLFVNIICFIHIHHFESRKLKIKHVPTEKENTQMKKKITSMASTKRILT